MGAASRTKGARGELEACEVLGRIGLDCRRQTQYANRTGGHKQADVVCDQADLWIEVKRSEHLSPYRYIGQALDDSKGKQPACVLMRSSHRPWLFMCRLDDLPRIIEEVQRARAASVPGEPDGEDAGLQSSADHRGQGPHRGSLDEVEEALARAASVLRDVRSGR